MYDKMSVLQQVLTDARKLATRLRDHDSSADSLLSQAQGMFKQVESMKEENKELRLALEEHQNVMELIMSKYRQQVAKLVTVNSKQAQPNTQEQAKLAAQIERISEMVAVMRKAASLGDDECEQQQRLITALATENKGLREMLNIASRSGSILPAACSVDAGTQTEHELRNFELCRSQEQESVDKDVVQEEKQCLESSATSAS
ncbi:suppressor of IKBKE 1-like isoform X2 [Panulirus ornatus]|uniref:suppressor of IKBKE 1-like isoform X2 n=1 Tax=Panulirus ornatus TaxID=150431 RepID=UPI003A8B65C1